MNRENKKKTKKIETIKLYVHTYDNPLKKDGTKKENQFLGEFELLEGTLDDYSYEVYGRNVGDGRIYKIIGKEVSGFYHPLEGGTRNFIELLEESPDVKAYIRLNNLLKDKSK